MQINITFFVNCIILGHSETNSRPGAWRESNDRSNFQDDHGYSRDRPGFRNDKGGFNREDNRDRFSRDDRQVYLNYHDYIFVPGSCSTLFFFF